MNGLIFKIFGVAILVFDLLLVVITAISISRPLIRNAEIVPALIVYFGFLLISTVIAIGLIRHQRWAAITASVMGLVWSLILAGVLGNAPWQALIIGMPVAFGLLTPLYATIKYWPSLKSVENPKLNSFFLDLRSQDQLHLK